MSARFKLEAVDRISPGTGEDLGRDLHTAAANLANTIEAIGWNSHQRQRVAALYYLAADAYDRGASASLGHGRRDRYTEEARRLRALAEETEAPD